MSRINYKEGDLVGGCLYLKDVECPSHLKNKRRFAKFVCTCGEIFERDIISQKHTNGKCNACYQESVGKWNKTHGEPHRSKEYKLWCAIKERCYNTNCIAYDRYGGRGISVYEGWLNDFPAFLEHVGRAPTPKHSLDRIDNNKNYEPGNVRWATDTEQARNRKSSRIVDYNGQQITLAELSEKTGITTKMLRRRLDKGMSGDDAVADAIKKINNA